MSIGAYVLDLMETGPAKPTGLAPLWAGSPTRTSSELTLIRRTTIPLQTIKWTNIVIHDGSCDGGDSMRGCHFLISGGGRYEDGRILMARRWDRQLDGDHVRVPGFDFNANSVGVCLLTAPGRTAPSARQRRALVALVRALQVTFAIPPDHVYLHRDLGEVHCPGGGIDATAFRKKLVSATR